MSPQAGTYALGPADGTLLVKTRKGGAAAKAGHDLTLEVTAWSATLQVGEPSSINLTADARSLRVRAGKGGVMPLGDDDRQSIRQSIDEEVLKRTPIEFRSTSVEISRDGRVLVAGELELSGRTAPIEFELSAGENGRLTGSAIVKQTAWGMKPFTILFGTLKVLDEVQVAIDVGLVH